MIWSARITTRSGERGHPCDAERNLKENCEMFPLLKYTAEEVDEYYAKVTPEMVRASLAKDRHDWFDLLNLVSPAAYPFMDEMRRKARLARIKYYGKTVSVYVC